MDGLLSVNGNSPLYKAHEAGRRAFKLIRKGKLSEAAEFHLKAAEILQTLTETLTEDCSCKRSLEEQVEFYKRQAELTTILREVVNTPSTKIRKMAEKPVTYSGERRKVLVPIVQRRMLPHPEIQKNFDVADSLLQILSERKFSPSRDLHKTQSVDETCAPRVEFTIRPKNDSEVIEELQTVNFNLRALVDKLINELAESREKYKILEAELEQYKKEASNSQAEEKENSSSNTPTPTVSQSMAEMEKIPETSTTTTASLQMMYTQPTFTSDLPELPPLETPKFDFTI